MSTMIPFTRTINGIEVNAWYSRENTGHIFIPLIEHMIDTAREKNSRAICFIAAPPAAGKSTLTEYLSFLAEEKGLGSYVCGIGMDGFHRYQDYLKSHTLIRDGKEIRMVEIKGAPETFDLARLTGKVKELAEGKEVLWPVYDRMRHNPVEDQILVDGPVVFLEGNYLLLDEPGWRDLASFCDMTVMIRAEKDLLFQRLVERKMATGVKREEAERFVRFSDFANAQRVLDHSKKAGLTLELLPDGTFKIQKND